MPCRQVTTPFSISRTPRSPAPQRFQPSLLALSNMVRSDFWGTERASSGTPFQPARSLGEPKLDGHFPREHQVPVVARLPDGRAEEHLLWEHGDGLAIHAAHQEETGVADDHHVVELPAPLTIHGPVLSPGSRMGGARTAPLDGTCVEPVRGRISERLERYAPPVPGAMGPTTSCVGT